MKYFSLILSVVLFLPVLSYGQAAAGVIAQKQRETSLLSHVLNDRTRAEGRDDINRINSNGTIDDRLKLARIREFYRIPSEQEQKSIAPDAEDQSRFADILKNKNAGLLRLMPDLGCDEVTLQASRSERCDELTIPGGGAAFSFRTRTHRPWRFADLIYDGRSFLAFGQGSQGFLANIGDVELDQLNDSSPGMKFMTDFVPATQFEKIRDQNQAFSNRVIDGDHVYSKVVPVKMNVTYLMRSIAYKAYVEREFEGVRFNELSFDKRTDVLVAFRVVRMSPDRSVTLLWRELRNIDSPKIADSK
jgi:hypothetical protein